MSGCLARHARLSKRTSTLGSVGLGAVADRCLQPQVLGVDGIASESDAMTACDRIFRFLLIAVLESKMGRSCSQP